MTTTTITTADLLDRAADLIEERGLAYGDFAGKDGCLCVRGAFHVAAGREATDCGLLTQSTRFTDYVCDCVEPSMLVADYLMLDPGIDVVWEPDAVSGWNDSDGMTAAEVVDTLRAVARLHRSAVAS